MSIEATNWAFAQRGLKPATKLILVFLADCHNRHTKQCDPSQATLADECEMSRSTVNVHLAMLERANLIRRIQRSDPRTKKQKRSFYILGCDQDLSQDVDKAVSEIRTRKSGKAVSGKQPKPCPENGQSRVRTVGHEPELNPKGTARARKPQFFTDDERFKARQVIDALNEGVQVNFDAVPDRIKSCIVANDMIPNEMAEKLGLI